MQKKKQTTQTKQTIIFIAVVTIVLLITFAEDIIKLASKNKIALQENSPNETTLLAPNVPVISAGMIPIKWNGTNWIITTREDKDWYDYKTGKPAYVMLNDGYYRSEIERGVTDDQLMANAIGNDALAVPDVPDNNPTILMWIPSFAYNEDGDIQYIKDIEQSDENWTTPSIFTHKQVAETAPDFLLTGIWFEIDVDSEYASKINEMNTKDSIYGFIKNTIAISSDQTTGNEIQTYINKLSTDEGTDDQWSPLQMQEDTNKNDLENATPQNVGASTARPQITDITNPNRVILKIINQRNQIPIKAKGAYNKQTGLIEIQVTYSQYGINKIMLEDAELTISKNNNRATATNEGIELEDGKTYKITIIDNKENTKELQIQVIFPIYATLYTDGTLAFASDNNKISGKIVSKSYELTNQYVYPPWYSENNMIKIVEFVNKIKPKYTAHWFGNCKNLTTINNIENLDTSNVIDMQYMFAYCSALKELNLNSFNTSNVVNMHYMFYSCSNLRQLYVSNFNTENVTCMQQMFSGCSNLTSLDVNNFNTSNVTDMCFMFSKCNLSSLNLGNFDTRSATDMRYMFYNCSNLKNIYVGSNWRTSQADRSNMFSGCGTNKVTQIQ